MEPPVLTADSKQEVASNVLDYYRDPESRAKLEAGISQYTEQQGKGFVCWRFLMSRIH